MSQNLKTVGIRAFNECTSLTKITLPDSVTSIGNYAFNDCENLKSVEILSNVKTIGIGVFDGCDSVTISGYNNTPIQTYANKNKISFHSLGIGVLTLDTKNITVSPRASFVSGYKLIGSNLTTKIYSSNKNIAKVERLSSTQYRVTGMKAGTAYIMFDIYDKNSKKLTHASVKVIVKRGTTARCTSGKQTAKF
jgi:hypothetical protein